MRFILQYWLIMASEEWQIWEGDLWGPSELPWAGRCPAIQRVLNAGYQFMSSKNGVHLWNEAIPIHSNKGNDGKMMGFALILGVSWGIPFSDPTSSEFVSHCCANNGGKDLRQRSAEKSCSHGGDQPVVWFELSRLLMIPLGAKTRLRKPPEGRSTSLNGSFLSITLWQAICWDRLHIRVCFVRYTDNNTTRTHRDTYTHNIVHIHSIHHFTIHTIHICNTFQKHLWSRHLRAMLSWTWSWRMEYSLRFAGVVGLAEIHWTAKWLLECQGTVKPVVLKPWNFAHFDSPFFIAIFRDENPTMELGLGACGALMTMALSIFGLFVPRKCSRFNRG